jgi:copper chaperone
MNTTTENAEARDYIVEGMTCSHCVLSVREEVSEVPGVSAVEVDLPSGRMTVSGRDLDDEAVRAAVTEAGYDLAA